MAVETYTEADFINAVYLLLPPGDYWKKNDEQQTLSLVVGAIGKELYQTYIDNQQTLLFQQDNSATNWRIADYQSLLDAYQKHAHVSDNPATPNIIDFELTTTDGIDDMLLAVIKKLLPHTAANWRMAFGVGSVCTLRMMTYQRIEAIE